jgi:site-specific recombinase XerD
MLNKTNRSLEKHLDDFLMEADCNGLSLATLRTYRGMIGQFVKYASSVGASTAADVDETLVRDFFRFKSRTCKPVSRNDYYRHVRLFLNWLIERGIIKFNPMESMKPPKVERKIIKPFSRDDIKKLLSCCDDSKFLGARNKAFILLLLDTGLRLSEAMHLTKEDVDCGDGIINIMGKGMRERVVRIGKTVRKALWEYQLFRDDEYNQLWLTEERKAIAPGGMAQMINKLGKLAGLRNVRCSAHTFRHTAATQSLENGALELHVPAMLGHSTLSMTRRYVSSLNSARAAEAHAKFSPVEHLGLK